MTDGQDAGAGSGAQRTALNPRALLEALSSAGRDEDLADIAKLRAARGEAQS